MTPDPNEAFDHAVLDLIETSPVGAVPGTPAYQDALRRLTAAQQVFSSADHKDGYVTARSLGRLPSYCARNLDDLAAGTIEAAALESNAAIFERYRQSLPASRVAAAEARRAAVIGRAVHHRAKHAVAPVHDPIHSLILVPGAGPHPGLPGNYLYGDVGEKAGAPGQWTLSLHDGDDAVASADAASLPEAVAKLHEVLDSAPFHLSELDALGFRSH